MHQRSAQLVLTAVLLLAGSFTARAQNGQVSGRITDPQGAAVPNLTVQVINQADNSKKEVQTNESGSFAVSNLLPGAYRLVIEPQGFSPVSKEFTIALGQAAVLNVQLEVESVKTSVNVKGGVAAEVKTESAELTGIVTSTELVSLGLNGRNFTQLIALTPGVSNQTGQDEGKVGVLGSAKYSVNGGRVEYNTFEVDGSDVLNNSINASRGGNTLIVYPSVDALQEVKVLTSNYGAMYGRTASGTVLATTKSGTATFHGNAYEFVRNEKFNARNFFDQTSSAPLYRRNDFGYTLGGPFFIPHHYNTTRDKTFFFFSQEFRRERTPQDFNQAVPSMAERKGDFNDVCPHPSGVFRKIDYPDCPIQSVSMTNPRETDMAFVPFAGNQLPPPYLSPYGAALLSTGLIPAPNATSGCNSSVSSCYVASVSPSTSWREELFRVDHNLNAKTQLSFRFIHDAWDTTVLAPQWGVVENSFPTVENDFHGPGVNIATHLTRTLSTSLVNEVSFSYTTDHITLTDVPGPGANLARPGILDNPCVDAHVTAPFLQCPLGAIFQNGFGGKIPGIVIEGNNAAYGGHGFSADTSYMPWKHSNPTYVWRDDATKVIGRHTLQFGGQFVFAQQNETNAVNGANSGDIQGLLRYSNLSQHTSGNAFANFLIGPGGYVNGPSTAFIGSYQQDSNQFQYYNRYKMAEPYFQDNWRMSSHLTVNVGVRLSLFGTWYNKYGTAYNWEPAAFSPSLAAGIFINNLTGGTLGSLWDVRTNKPLRFDFANLDPRLTNGLLACGQNGVPRSCMRSHIFNPAPRIGFAWDPRGDGKTSIRAGYGIFFEHGTSYEANTGSLIGSAPVVLSATQLSPPDYRCIGGGRPGTTVVIFGFTCDGSKPIAFPLNVTSIPIQARYPYAQQWSLGVEREIRPGLVAGASYVGSKGTRLTAERQINQLTPVPDSQNPFGPGQPLQPFGTCTGVHGTFNVGNTVIKEGQPAFINLEAACFPFSANRLDPNTFRRYPGYSRIVAIDNIADSHYHAMQLTLRRTEGPLILGVAYTWSHSIDDSSDRADATFVNSFDLSSNRASSNFDQRHLLAISYVYQLPFYRAGGTALNHSRLTRTLLGGWEISGITVYQSGTPFSVINGGSPSFASPDNAGVANGEGLGSYADWSGAVDPYSAPPGGGDNARSFGPLLLNPGAFSAPRGLTFGNSGRNSLHNPGRVNFNVAMLKHIRVRGERDVEFRAEAFNIFNNTQFRIYDPTHPGNTGNNIINCYGGRDAKFSSAGGGGIDCLTGGSFLRPVDAHDPRIVQFGLKFSF